MGGQGALTLRDLPDWAAALLEDVPVGHLGLIDEDGQPRVQPVSFARVGDVLVSAIDDAKPKRDLRPARVRRLEANPRATLTVDRYDADWAKLAWVQVLATAVVRDVDEASLSALQSRYPTYRELPPPGPLIELSPVRVLCWRASG